MQNYREFCFDILYKVIYENEFINFVIDKIFNKNDIKDSDKAKIRRDTYGIIENKILLDYIISKYSKAGKIDKKIYIVLYIGIYELLFTDNIKKYAVVNECVNIAKKQKSIFLANYVNAILKNIEKNENIDNILNDEKIPIKIRYSVTDDVYKYLYENEFSDNDIVKIFRYYNNYNHIYIRINTNDKKIISEIKKEFDEKKINYNEYDDIDIKYTKTLRISLIGDIKHLNSYREGLISVVDISSIYFINELYDIYINSIVKSKDRKIIDCCSAPGGKILTFYNLMKMNSYDEFKTTKFYACDISESKIKFIRDNMIREKCEDIDLSISDATVDVNELYDLVICDVPCSGLGVIGKKPDIKYNFKLKNVDRLINLQKKILNSKKNNVKKGGIISYSTCTLGFKENNNIVAEFLLNNDNFILLEEKNIISDEQNLADGFYFAIMKKIK